MGGAVRFDVGMRSWAPERIPTSLAVVLSFLAQAETLASETGQLEGWRCLETECRHLSDEGAEGPGNGCRYASEGVICKPLP